MRDPASVLARGAGGVLAASLLAFLAAPVLLLVGAGAAGLAGAMSDAELRAALATTLATATGATVLSVAGGLPLAYALARRTFPGRGVATAVLDLPLLVPHPVAGIALLLFLGRDTPLGHSLASAGLRVVGTPAGIVAAMTFVSAPLFVSAAREAFARVDPYYAAMARTLGDTPARAFARVTLPLALRGIGAAAIVTWARAVSEFGAIVVLAYNPKVASVLSYDRLTGYGLAAALPVAAALVLVALVPLAALRLLRYDARAESVR